MTAAIIQPNCPTPTLTASTVSTMSGASVEQLQCQHDPDEDRRTTAIVERVLEMAMFERKVVAGTIFATAAALDLTASSTDDAEVPQLVDH